MNSKTFNIATVGILSALITVMATVPFLGFIPIGIVNLTLLLIPIAVCCQTQNVIVSTCISAYFGVLSLIMAFLGQQSLLTFCFQNPMVSVLPRIAIGPATYYANKLFVRLFSNSQNTFVRRMLPLHLSAAVAVIVNTGLVLAMITIFYFGESVGSAFVNGPLMAGILLTAFLPELAFNILIVPPITMGVNKARGRIRV